MGPHICYFRALNWELVQVVPTQENKTSTFLKDDPQFSKYDLRLLGVPKTFLGSPQGKNYFHNNMKTLFLFDCRFVTNGLWNFPEAT